MSTATRPRNFRRAKKTSIFIQIPPRIDRLIRQRACDGRTSISQVSTELFSQALGIDPAEFGIPAVPTEPADQQISV